MAETAFFKMQHRTRMTQSAPWHIYQVVAPLCIRQLSHYCALLDSVKQPVLQMELPK